MLATLAMNILYIQYLTFYSCKYMETGSLVKIRTIRLSRSPTIRKNPGKSYEERTYQRTYQRCRLYVVVGPVKTQDGQMASPQPTEVGPLQAMDLPFWLSGGRGRRPPATNFIPTSPSSPSHLPLPHRPNNRPPPHTATGAPMRSLWTPAIGAGDGSY